MSRKSARHLLSQFEERLGCSFSDTSLLQRALSHSALTGEPQADNERLEFLGDRVLGLVIAEELLQRFPDAAEGSLARRLNALVSKSACTAVAETMGLDGLLREFGGRSGEAGVTARALADVCEALIAAIYLDTGLDAARGFILTHWRERLEAAGETRRDPKSQLQEWAMGKGLAVPEYAVTGREGPDHAPVFTIAVSVAGHAPIAGEGASKREAEQAAALAFLKQHKIKRT
jgi:ribonuclease-3